jgi:hypothetical protein
MINEALEIENSIPYSLCDDIINMFENAPEDIICKKYKREFPENFEFKQLEIPKNTQEWVKIEILLYKQLLININKYKDLVFNIKNMENELNRLLTKRIILTSFNIQKYFTNENDILIEDFNKNHSRYNFLTFVYYLNNSDKSEICINNLDKNVSIKPKKGKLVIFSENLNYKYKYKMPQKESNLYIITGTFYYMD